MNNKIYNFSEIYSESFTDFLKNSQTKLEKIIEDCEKLKTLFEETPLLLPLLKTLSKSQQKEIFFLTVKTEISSLWKHFFYVLIDDQKIYLLPKIINILQKKLEETINLERGNIYSFVKLTFQQITKLNQLFHKLLKQKILLENKIDVNLIGGLRVEIGNHSWDNSISGQLNNLRKELMR